MRTFLNFALTSLMAAALFVPAFAQTAAAPQTAPKAVTKAAKPAPMPPQSDQQIADAKAKGMVWVNLNSKVYHTEGPYYGKTKSGKFMTKDDAEKAGYKAAKEPAARKKAAKQK